MSIKEAAAICDISDRTMRAHIQAKKIVASKIGGLWKIKRQDVDAFIATGSNQLPTDEVAA